MKFQNKTVYVAMSPNKSLRDLTGQAGDMKQKVYVAMSGGVDSSVAAALLKQQGFNVVGVFMKPWSPSAPISNSKSYCPWRQDREDAMRVASIIGIPLLTWDFSKEYGEKVTRYMIEAYRRGITPNPDVMCNKEIKFGLFFRRAVNEGADFIATGHYARIKREFPISKFQFPNKSQTPIFKLLMAKDKNKDQSYFLWTLKQKQLKKCLFPIGEYTKPEVRRLAKKFNLPVHNKKDSQGVCFIGPLNMKSFLKTKIKSRRGDIMHLDGRTLGEHDGAAYYTIGQRHGLNITLGGGPYFVVKKDMKKNIITVGSERDLQQRDLRVMRVHSVRNRKLPATLEVKIRYRTQAQPARLEKNILKFRKPQRAITPGQSAVLYKGSEVLGGAIIA